MNILLSNDDGVFAEGIEVLAEYLLKNEHNVYIVAPSEEQSGSSQGLTLHTPLRVKKYPIKGIEAFSVNGKPADCVKIAAWVLYKDIKFDLFISGINRGENLGSDVLYSGTVGAAAEACLVGIKSIALSLKKEGDIWRFNTAAKFIVNYLEKIEDLKFPENSLININVPNLEYEDIKGYKYTHQGARIYDDNFIRREDPKGDAYYWLGGEAVEKPDKPEADFLVIKEGYVSITPIKLNMTDESFLEILKERED